MGRSSGLILQAVCLGRWLTERQADAYVIAAKRHDSETASAGSLSVCDKSTGFDSARPPRGGDQSYRRRKSRYLPGRSCRSSRVTCYLSLEHDWWKQVTTSSGSVTAWNNPYSVVQWCVGVGEFLFPSQVTFERHPAALPWKHLWTCLAPLGVRSGLSDTLPFCHGRICVCVWGSPFQMTVARV